MNKKSRGQDEKNDKDSINREKLLKDVRRQLDDLSVKELVSIMASNLASVGFSKLGLKDSKDKDLDQAKLAIDSIDALYGVVSSKLTKEEKLVLQSAISNLKMVYAKEVSSETGKNQGKN